MKTAIFTVAATAAILAAPVGAQEQPAAGDEAVASPGVARAAFVDREGQALGTATLIETPNGVLVRAVLERLPPGVHGFHIHETGTCDPEGGFESAGGHYDPDGSQHGFMVEDGPHAGDMANQTVGDDGRLVAEVFNPRLGFDGGDAPLFDDDGSAIVIHSNADDYMSQPSGAAGDRIACGVIRQE